jgi:enamine deaminase RidA (YjgF/YER057c/UK114 family)
MTVEQRLQELHISLPRPPRPLGAYAEAVQSGNLLFISGTLPVDKGLPKYLGRIGAELSVEDGRQAVQFATLNALAAAREHLGSLDGVTHIVRLRVSLVTTPEFRDHAQVADAASELLAGVFGKDKTSTRMVLGVVSLPLGTSAAVELVFEVTG